MTKEELIEFLKENLEIEVELEEGYYGSSDSHRVILKLEDEITSEDYF